MVCIGGCRLVEGIIPRGWRLVEGLVLPGRDIQARAEVVQVVGKIYTCAGCHRDLLLASPLLCTNSGHC